MQYQHSLLYLLAALPSALCTTTIQAYLAPPHAAASVIAVANSATTYSIICTSDCPAAGEFTQATLVNGPSTAAFTNLQDGGSKTLILDCPLSGNSETVVCVQKAITTGSTVSVTSTLKLSKDPVAVTGGLELLGYKVVVATAEVNVTTTAKTTSGTETITSGVPKTKSAAPTVVSLTDSASITRAAVTSAAKSMGEATQTSTSKGAAPTLGPMGMGAALVGVAGFVLAAL